MKVKTMNLERWWLTCRASNMLLMNKNMGKKEKYSFGDITSENTFF